MSNLSIRTKPTPGLLYTMGKGAKGQLGLGSTKQCMTPTLIDKFDGEKIIDFDAGSNHNLAVTESGRLFAWGSGSYHKLGFDADSSVEDPVLVPGIKGLRIVRVACGAHHSVALTDDGMVLTWGWGGSMFYGCGGLGQGSASSNTTEPTAIQSLINQGVVSISAGAYHTAALCEDGRLFTWGKGEFGRLGHGNNKDQVLPEQVVGLNEKWRHVTTGTNCTAAITKNGQLYMWGKNRAGELGEEAMNVFAQESAPFLVDALKDKETLDVEVGSQHTVATMADGEVFIWGAAGFSWFTPHLLTPLSPPTLKKGNHVIQVAAGHGFTAAVTEKGEVYTWGKARKGQLGHDSKSFMHNPKRVHVTPSVKRVACGQTHTVMLASSPLEPTN